jgi:hypothetical protein
MENIKFASSFIEKIRLSFVFGFPFRIVFRVSLIKMILKDGFQLLLGAPEAYDSVYYRTPQARVIWIKHQA